MNMKEVASLARSEWRCFIRSGFLPYLAVAHLIIVAVAVLASWPSSLVPGSPGPVLTWNWYNYVMLATLTYIALATAADAAPIPDRIAPYEWVYYDVVRPTDVLAGRFIAHLALAAVLILLSLPLGILAHAAHPVPFSQVVGTATVIFTLLLISVAAGSFVSAGVSEPALRAVAAHALYLAGLALFLVAGGWIAPSPKQSLARLNPLGAMHYFLERDPDAPFTAPFPWIVWTLLYGAVLALFLTLAHTRLRQWRSAQSPPTGRWRIEGGTGASEKESVEASAAARGERA